MAAKKRSKAKKQTRRRSSKKKVPAATFAAFIIAAVCIGLGIKLFGFTMILSGAGGMPQALPNGSVALVSRMAVPERGDIVLAEGSFTRVVGMPGDTVAVSGGRLTVNGAFTDEPYTTGEAPDAAETKLGAGQYLLMPDDRTRGGLVVTAADIYGVALFRLWPLNTFAFL